MEQNRKKFLIECAERHLDAMKAFRNQKSLELYKAERMLADAHDQLAAARSALNDDPTE